MNRQLEIDVKALSKGDVTVFQKLYENFFGALCVFAREFYVEKMEAEDIVQEVFYRLYDKKQYFSNITTLKAYLYSAVRNSCLNHIRTEKRRKQREFSFLEEISEENYFFDQIVQNEVYRELRQLLEELPEQCRNIFKYTLQGETSEQIARRLNLSVETVKTQRKKAKRILRERYKILYRTIGILFIIH